MEQINFKEDGKSLYIFIPRKLFSKEAILNCLYWRLGRSQVQFLQFSEEEFQVSLNLSRLSNKQIINLKTTFTNDLIDYELREIVSKETRNLRELIIAKAFANGTLDDLES